MTIIKDGKLWLYGYVGDPGAAFFEEEGFTASDVMDALAEHGRDQDLTVHINSGGGDAYDGIAIYNALAAHKGQVRVEIDAIAASSASIIAMAGDHIVMRAGSLMMIHDPSCITFGTADTHEKHRVALNKLADQGASIYAERSGGKAAEIREKMKDELWLTADEAVAHGFADEAEGAKAKPVAAFDYRTYAHAPKRLTALAAKKNWRLPEADDVTNQPTRKEPAMSDKTVSATAHTAATARIKAIMQAPEAKGRDKLAEHLAFDTTMEADAALAIMKVSPAADDDAGTDTDFYAARRLNGEGLTGGRPLASTTGGIVAAMKAKHGVK